MKTNQSRSIAQYLHKPNIGLDRLRISKVGSVSRTYWIALVFAGRHHLTKFHLLYPRLIFVCECDEVMKSHANLWVHTPPNAHEGNVKGWHLGGVPFKFP